MLGPRGTGKSTWLRDRLPDALYLDLLEPALHRSLSARPERLRDLLAGSPGKATVVIDEIQRVPELLTVIHAILEEPSPPCFVLTGSSARKLRRGGVDLLGGRAVHRTMHPFMAPELPEFDLDRALRLGLLPLVMDAADDLRALRAFREDYPETETTVLYRGSERLRIDGVMPIQQAHERFGVERWGTGVTHGEAGPPEP